MLHAEYNQAWRERQRAAGRCFRCGGPGDGGTFCAACRAVRKAGEDPEKRRARQQAYNARRREERKAGTSRPPLTGSERGRNGGRAAAKVLGAALTRQAVQEARRALLNVRSDFTAAQLADLDVVFARVYRLGNDRGYARGRQARYAADRRQQTTEAA